MPKAIRLTLVLALAVFAFWSSPRKSYALPLCDALANTACSTPYADRDCIWFNHDNGDCFCDPGTLTWNCS